jgi:hypothetical protein
MIQLIKKLVALEREITAEKGEFTLFALFLREESFDKWDLVLSAPWFWADTQSVYKYVADKLRSRLKSAELLSLSRFVLIEKDDPRLKAVIETIEMGHNPIEVRGSKILEVKDRTFFGLPIKHAYIIVPKGRNS